MLEHNFRVVYDRPQVYQLLDQHSLYLHSPDLLTDPIHRGEHLGKWMKKKKNLFQECLLMKIELNWIEKQTNQIIAIWVELCLSH